MNKKEDILDSVTDEYEKRNCLLKAGAGDKELEENKKNIDELLDRYIDECVGKVSKE